MKPALIRLGRFLGVGAVTLVAVLAGCQHKLIYHPRAYHPHELSLAGRNGAQQVKVTTSQGQQVAFFFPPVDPAAKRPFLWLVFGGNGSLALDYTQHLPRWDKRCAYLFVDYPGYGLCAGSPSPDRIRETISALRSPVCELIKVPPEKIGEHSGVLGHSIGCAAALIAAEECQISRAVLCAPFTSMTNMARLLLGSPLCYLNRHPFDNIARLEALQRQGAEVIIFHGDEDEVIPVTMARELAARFPSMVTYHEVAGTNHNEVLDAAGPALPDALKKLGEKVVAN